MRDDCLYPQITPDDKQAIHDLHRNEAAELLRLKEDLEKAHHIINTHIAQIILLADQALQITYRLEGKNER